MATSSSHNIIDLDHLVEWWAKKSFRARATKKENRLMDKDLISIKVDWRRVRFDSDPTPVYTPTPPAVGSVPDPQSSTLYETRYCNRTAAPQVYGLHAERKTRSMCEVSVGHTFTKSKEFGLKLATPESIFEANAGFKRELSVTNESGTVQEEEVTWGIDSQVTVPAQTRAVATVKVEEEHYKGHFRYSTRISGKVKVNYYDLKDNNSFIKAREHGVYDIMQEVFKDGVLQRSDDGLYCDEKDKAVVCMTRGECSFKYAVRQLVEVAHEQL